MKYLIDYSGEFEPKICHDTFSNKTLLELIKHYCEYLKYVDGIWYTSMVRKCGSEVALDCDKMIVRKGVTREVQMLSRLMNIEGNDVTTAMKALQLSPWIQTHDFDIEMRNNNHAIYTVKACPTLSILEKEGRANDTVICLEACCLGVRIILDHFNPNITITPLRLPPREHPDDLACQWEYRLEI